MIKQNRNLWHQLFRLRGIGWVAIGMVYLICTWNILLYLFFREKFALYEQISLSVLVLFVVTAIVPVFRNCNGRLFISRGLTIAALLMGLLSLFAHRLFSSGYDVNALPKVVRNIYFCFSQIPFLAGNFLIFSGIVIFLLTLHHPKATDLAHGLTLPVMIMSYMKVVSNILGVHPTIYYLNEPMLPGTAVCFFLICLVVFIFREASWFMRIYSGEGSGSAVFRRVLPLIIVVPFVVAWFRIRWERTGVFDSGTGAILVLIIYTCSLVVIVGISASRLNRADKKRKIAEEGLQQSEENLRAILNATQESIFLFDRDARFIDTNHIGLERYGLESRDVLGHYMYEFISLEQNKVRKGYLDQVFASGEAIHFEDERDGIWFEHHFYPCFRDGEVQYVASYSRDITELKKNKEKLEKNAAELSELNAMKDKFFRIIAHDMKNPFNVLIGVTQLLSESIDQYDQDKIKKFISILSGAVKNGYALLENLLEWAKAQMGVINFTPKCLDVEELIDENFSNMSIYAQSKKVRLRKELREKPTIMADRNMMTTVFRNIIENAIKFTGEDGEVTVSAARDERELMVIVKDTGMGIDPENIDKLFRIDIQYTNIGTANERGTGLGLLLCKEFVEKHGGRIWVESSVGEGSEFKFTIPFLPFHSNFVP
jgi:PAS domain S-box-containing protein